MTDNDTAASSAAKVQGMDDAPHFAARQSETRTGSIRDSWHVPGLLVVAMIALVIATAAGVSLLIMSKLDAALVPTQLQILGLHADARVKSLEMATQSVRADVLTFSRGISIAGILRADAAGGIDPVDRVPLAEWRDRLAHRLLDDLALKAWYYQIRLITADGQEFVRVERGPDGPRISPDAALQSKAQTGYFQAAMKLAAGDIYLSPIELNREHGVIETPVVPVIRFATPIFRTDGRIFGIFVTNLDLRGFFASIRSMAPLNGDVRIIDSDGNYLLHPDPAREFRFERGDSSRLSDDFPEPGQVPPDAAGQWLARDRSNELVGIAVAPGLIGQLRRFSVVEVMPYAALAAAPQPVREATLIAGIIAALGATVLAIVLANVLSRRLRRVMASVDSLSREQLAAAEHEPAATRKGVLQRLFRLLRPEREFERELVRRRHNELLMQTYHEQDRLYAAVVQSATDAIITNTLDGKITGWNAAAETLFGYAAHEAIGQPIDIIVPRERIDDVRELLDISRRGEHIDHFETVRRTKSGRLIDVSLSVSPVRTPLGEIIGSAKIVRDVSEQKFNQRKFELAVEASPGGVLMINPRGEILLANGELERQFGYHRNELVGASVDILLPGSMQKQHAARRDNFFADPAIRRMGAGRDLNARRKDGSEFPVEIGLNPIQSNDGMLVLATVIDISARKEAERAIEAQNERLRRSNAELEQFAYVASHDLQEPLRMVASYTQLLEERYRDKLDDKANKYIAYAVEGAKRMQTLVRDLLSYSRVSAHEVTRRPVDSGAVVRAAIERLAASIEESRAEILIGHLPVVLGDEIELGQVFQNLISNAIKFRNERRPRIEINAYYHDGLWEFWVKDNGIGIEEKYSNRIFQMFQRLHERGKYDGSGIGLAIVKKIVERHGGSIWFVSTSGEGTTFHFTALAQAAPAKTTTITTTETVI
jgi:PAS domain S-box-containing protein